MNITTGVIQKVQVRLTYRVNHSSLLALGLPSFFNVWVPDAVPMEGETWATHEAEAQALMYPRKLLEVDGFVSTKILMEISKQHQQLWSIFGPPKDWGDQRCHLVFPARYAEKQHNLQVSDWEIKEWKKRTLAQI